MLNQPHAPSAVPAAVAVSTLPAFQDFLLDLVHQHWKARSEPLLLARIGQAAVQRGYSLPDALGTLKLSDYIHRELPKQLELVNPPETPSQFAVKPRGVQTSTAQASSAEPSPSAEAPKLIRSLWAAFARPIQPGFERRVQLTPFVRFWDLAPPLNEVAGRLPIGPEYVAKPVLEPGSGRRDNVVFENIRRWMRDNKLDLSEFEEGAQKTALPRVSSQNPLLTLIASLDESDLRRVTLPLDVIAKLLKK